MIRIEGLQKNFQDGTKSHSVLKDLTLELENGDFLALVGRSGSGKSTLLNCIAGIESIDSGSIHIADKDITCMDDGQLTRLRRDEIGIIFQFFNLLPNLSVLDNILLPGLLRGKRKSDLINRAEMLLKELGIEKLGNSMPEKLSGGQQQRVATARALMNKPSILLADEPTGNLDIESAEQSLALLKEVNDKFNVTILMVTHSTDAAAIAKTHAELIEGKIEFPPEPEPIPEVEPETAEEEVAEEKSEPVKKPAPETAKAPPPPSAPPKAEPTPEPKVETVAAKPTPTPPPPAAPETFEDGHEVVLFGDAPEAAPDTAPEPVAETATEAEPTPEAEPVAEEIPPPPPAEAEPETTEPESFEDGHEVLLFGDAPEAAAEEPEPETVAEAAPEPEPVPEPAAVAEEEIPPPPASPAEPEAAAPESFDDGHEVLLFDNDIDEELDDDVRVDEKKTVPDTGEEGDS